jgi:hypothetical protein
VNINTDSSGIVSSLPDMAYDKAADAARLKAIYERIVDGRGESRADFGRRTGLGKPANVGHYLNGKNNLTIDTARKFAAGIPCKIEDFSPHWARMAHASGKIAMGEKQIPPVYGGVVLMEGATDFPYLVTPVKDVDSLLKLPLLSWGQVDLMLETNIYIAGLDGVSFVDAESETVGPRTKFLIMPDDSMSPRIEKGDRLTVEPDWAAEPGEIALLRDQQGEHYIRRIKSIRSGHFIAEPENSAAFESLDSAAFGLVIVGVVVARREFLAKRKR